VGRWPLRVGELRPGWALEIGQEIRGIDRQAARKTVDLDGEVRAKARDIGDVSLIAGRAVQGVFKRRIAVVPGSDVWLDIPLCGADVRAAGQIVVAGGILALDDQIGHAP